MRYNPMAFLMVFVIMAVFSVGMGSFLLSAISGDNIFGGLSLSKSSYIISQEEKKVLLARAGVKLFLDAVKDGDYQEAFKYWNLPSRDHLWKKVKESSGFSSSEEATQEGESRKNICLIVDFLSDFENFSLGFIEQAKKVEDVNQFLYLAAEPAAVLINQEQNYTKINYSAQYKNYPSLELSFYVFFSGPKCHIKKVLIRGSEDQVNKLLSNKNDFQKIRDYTYLYPVSPSLDLQITN